MNNNRRVAVRAFIQARMSSSRFPGKALAPFLGRPIISHVVDRAAQALPAAHIVVATSAEASDDPLACYLKESGVSVFRGPLNDVFERFRLCLDDYPCDWFLRLCADSPLLDAAVLRSTLSHSSRADLDLVTNVFPRTFPRGCSVEMLLSSTFRSIDSKGLTAEEREHLTKRYYAEPKTFRILNILSREPGPAPASLAVDTPDDLHRLEGRPVQGASA